MSRICAYCGYANPDYIVNQCLDCNRSLASARQKDVPVRAPNATSTPALKTVANSSTVGSLSASITGSPAPAAPVRTALVSELEQAIPAMSSRKAPDFTGQQTRRTVWIYGFFLLVLLLVISIIAGAREVQYRFPETTDQSRSLTIPGNAHIAIASPPQSPDALIGLALAVVGTGLVVFWLQKKENRATFEVSVGYACISAILIGVLAWMTINLSASLWIVFLKALIGTHLPV